MLSMCLQRGHQVFQIVAEKLRCKTWEIWVRGNGFQNNYFSLWPASVSPVERRVKLGISWQGLIINVDLLTKEMLPYYTGKVFFLNCQ